MNVRRFANVAAAAEVHHVRKVVDAPELRLTE
jgi:hypothetical protein